MFVDNILVTHVAPMLPSHRCLDGVLIVGTKYMMVMNITILTAIFGVRIASMNAIKLRR
jgi:hypothetical protein